VSSFVTGYKRDLVHEYIRDTESRIEALSGLCGTHQCAVYQFLEDAEKFRAGTLLIPVMDGREWKYVPLNIYYARYYESKIRL